jgi:anti-sigma-K factor RskA
MNLKLMDENSIKQYLLGTLREDDREEVEKRLLTDEEYFQEVLSAEDNLIEDYLSGNLSNQERDKFEAYFMTVPEHREAVRNARILREHFFEQIDLRSFNEKANSAKVSWWHSFIGSINGFRFIPQTAIATLLVMLVLAVVWKASLREPSQPEIANNIKQQSDTNNQILNETPKADIGNNKVPENSSVASSSNNVVNEVKQPSKQKEIKQQQKQPYPKQLIAQVGLYPNSMMSLPTLPELIIKPGTQIARLTVFLDPNIDDNSYRDYQVELRSFERGSEIETQSNEKSLIWGPKKVEVKNKKIILDFPTSLLKRTTFYIVLYGKNENAERENIGTYNFKTVWK